MRQFLVLLAWILNITLFGLAIYIHYFIKADGAIGLVVGGIVMLLFITLPVTDYIFNIED